MPSVSPGSSIDLVQRKIILVTRSGLKGGGGGVGGRLARLAGLGLILGFRPPRLTQVRVLGGIGSIGIEIDSKLFPQPSYLMLMNKMARFPELLEMPLTVIHPVDSPISCHGPTRMILPTESQSRLPTGHR